MSTALGFTQSFLQTKPLNAELIRPGDTLNLTVWENVTDGLLSSGVGGAATLSELQVDGSGHIFVPYAGRIKVAGHTPEAIRQIVTQALQEQTPDPQVEVRRSAGAGATVSIIGSVGGQGIYPILHQTRTLSTMLASSGGLDVKAELVRVTVIRGKLRSEVWLDELYDRPEMDIALRDGDRILIEADQRSFVIMGATGRQSQVSFRSAGNFSAGGAITCRRPERSSSRSKGRVCLAQRGSVYRPPRGGRCRDQRRATSYLCVEPDRTRRAVRRARFYDP